MDKNRAQKHVVFAQFVAEHQAALRSFLRVIGVHKDSVDDMAQETFLIAFRKLDQYDIDKDFGKWLRGIARNLTRSELRKSSRRNRLLDQHMTECLLLKSEEYDSMKVPDFTNLKSCINSLPDKSQQLVLGHYVDRINCSSLAGKYEMTANAVRLALMRIRKQLRICIENQTRNA